KAVEPGKTATAVWNALRSALAPPTHPPIATSSPVPPTTAVDGWAFDVEAARRTLLDQFRAGSLDGFGLSNRHAAISAAGALIHYLRATQKVDLAHVRSIAYRQRTDCLLIDPTTLKHL